MTSDNSGKIILNNMEKVKETDLLADPLNIDEFYLDGGDIGEFSLSDLMDVATIQSLMDDFYNITHVGVAILDDAGEVLVATGWQDICTRFHRIHPEARKHCIESDTKLTENIKPGEFFLYKCKNNMWDIATPIVIAGKHLGNLFLGQFLFEDEQPDIELFREQARMYEFPEEEYLAALLKVPKWSREHINTVMSFYTRITLVISSLGLKNAQLKRALADRETILRELGESKAMLSGILNSIPQAIFWKDKNCVYLGCNEKFSATVGLSKPEEITGKTDFDLPWPDHEAEIYRKDDQQVIGTNRIKAHIIEPLQTVDGARLWIDTTKVPLNDINGNVMGVLGVYDDVTERLQAEERMKIITERLKLAQEASNAGTWDWNIPDNTFYWSDEFLKIFGMGPDTTPGFEAWTKRLHPDDVEMASKQIMDAIEGHRELINDCRIIMPTGEIRWIRAKGHALYENDKPVRMLGLCIDITYHKQIELELRASEDKFSKAFHQAPLLMAISQLEDGKYVQVNDEFLRITGFTREEIIGRTSVELKILTIESRQKLVNEILEKGQIDNLELAMMNKDKQITHCLFKSQKIEWDGKTHLFSTALDITRKKQVEEDLQHEMARLELLNSHMVNRELRMIELKKENSELKMMLAENHEIHLQKENPKR